MKLNRIFASLLVGALTYMAHANAESQFFVGQAEHDGNEKNIFLLEVAEEEMDNHVHISESGEIWLKVDRLLKVGKGQVAHQHSGSGSPVRSFLSEISGEIAALEVRCSKCGYYYEPSPPYYQCPRCSR